MTVDTRSGLSVEVDVVTVKGVDAGSFGPAESEASFLGTQSPQSFLGPKRSGNSKKNRFFLLFGEHARELVSPESALHFLETLCGKTELAQRQKELIQRTLVNSEFRMIVNGNPNSRRRVEEGDYCLRVNANGVDLNRNWAEKWEPEQDAISADTNPGPKPFSEDETQIFRKEVADYRPTSFLTVHSGTKGMYMPWAYDMEHLAKKNGPEMMQILRNLDRDYCQCPYGAAGKEVGYSCPGTCLDYVYDHLGVEYSFAFEIYTRQEEWGALKQRYQEKQSEEEAEGVANFMQLSRRQKGLRLGGSNQTEEEQDCFTRFNPATEEELGITVETWSKAYLDLANQIAQNMGATGGDT